VVAVPDVVGGVGVGGGVRAALGVASCPGRDERRVVADAALPGAADASGEHEPGRFQEPAGDPVEQELSVEAVLLGEREGLGVQLGFRPDAVLGQGRWVDRGDHRVEQPVDLLEGVVFLAPGSGLVGGAGGRCVVRETLGRVPQDAEFGAHRGADAMVEHLGELGEEHRFAVHGDEEHRDEQAEHVDARAGLAAFVDLGPVGQDERRGREPGGPERDEAAAGDDLHRAADLRVVDRAVVEVGRQDVVGVGQVIVPVGAGVLAAGHGAPRRARPVWTALSAGAM